MLHFCCRFRNGVMHLKLCNPIMTRLFLYRSFCDPGCCCNMHKITLLALLFCSTQVVGVRDRLLELENEITCVLNYPNAYAYENELKKIRANAIVNRVFHDGLNARELQNVHVCLRFAFEEILAHLNLRAPPFATKVFEKNPEPVKRLDPSNTDAFFEVLEEIEGSVGSIDRGEFIQAVDTLAQFVQTRFQHDRRYAERYANVSTTLIKKIIAPRKFDVGVLLTQLGEMARLARDELKAYPERAHVELFLGGLRNMLSVFKNAQNESDLQFWKRTFVHSLDSVYEGREHVKQALAICASQRGVKNYDYERATTAEIKRELRSRTVTLGRLPIVQNLAVRTHNIFRLSHEETLQGLFLHLSYVLVDMEEENAIDVLQNVMIDSYRRGRRIDATTDFFRKLLIILQRKLLNRLFK
ncbi:hypothetical protein FQR65_LT13340 [Abscondita terminalis]|nr:hypothetical protein FQR65_LT13340 [Abscondita terminalis]